MGLIPLGESAHPPPKSRVKPRTHLTPGEVNPRIHLTPAAQAASVPLRVVRLNVSLEQTSSAGRPRLVGLTAALHCVRNTQAAPPATG